MPLSDLGPGSTFAAYRIERELGRGGMGVVLLALQPSLNRKVALKVIAPSFASDPTFRSRFQREATHAASLDHPNVVPVYDTGEFEGQLYLAMRYVEGTDLGSVLASRGRLAAPDSARIVGQVASRSMPRIKGG